MIEILQEAGLSPNESRVYEALLSLGESSVQIISVKAGVHRRNVYDSLAKLIEKGLVSEIFARGEKRFQPVHPRRLLELVQQKEERLTKILPALENRFHRVDATRKHICIAA
jgi:sugar-specific transcriptional regulator TrmB